MVPGYRRDRCEGSKPLRGRDYCCRLDLFMSKSIAPAMPIASHVFSNSHMPSWHVHVGGCRDYNDTTSLPP